MKYSVRLINSTDGLTSYLNDKDKTSWTMKTAIKKAVEFMSLHDKGNYDFDIVDEFNEVQPHPFKEKLPIRDDVTNITWHRKPTPSEIKFGYGSTHYLDVTVQDCCHKYKGKFYKPKTYVNPSDKLTYRTD